jgi:hypothetical protein
MLVRARGERVTDVRVTAGGGQKQGERSTSKTLVLYPFV